MKNPMSRWNKVLKAKSTIHPQGFTRTEQHKQQTGRKTKGKKKVKSFAAKKLKKVEGGERTIDNCRAGNVFDDGLMASQPLSGKQVVLGHKQVLAFVLSSHGLGTVNPLNRHRKLLCQELIIVSQVRCVWKCAVATDDFFCQLLAPNMQTHRSHNIT